MTDSTKFVMVVIVLLAILIVLGGCSRESHKSSESTNSAPKHEPKADKHYDPRLDGPYWYGVG